jgi:hypothetical protein
MTDSPTLDELVLSWLSPDDHDPASVSQHDAQQLAWYLAPQRWNLPERRLAEVAAACARVLESSGRHRAATALREHTPAVLAGWARAPRDGFAAYAKAMQATGVQPPDTPTLTWGQLMGPDENAVHTAAERMLESAIDAGRFTPGGPGWRSAQRDVLEAWLSTPSAPFAGRAPVEVVHAERVVHWADTGPEARRTILRGVLPRLPRPTDRAGDQLEPLRLLLDTIHDGITLTPTGRLPPSWVREAAARFGWGSPAFKIRHEGDIVEVGEIRDLAIRARLIAVRRRQLTLTPAGQAAREDSALRWDAATAGWFEQDDFAAHVAEIAAAMLLAEPATGEAMTCAAHEAVAPSFHDREGNQPDLRDVRTALWDWLRPGHALDWLHYPHGIGERHYTLTDRGQAAALDGLRHRSHAPAATHHRPPSAVSA